MRGCVVLGTDETIKSYPVTVRSMNLEVYQTTNIESYHNNYFNFRIFYLRLPDSLFQLLLST